MKTVINVANVANVEKVYSGKANLCCCGCSGKYWDNDGQKANAKMVTRVVNAINKADERDVETESSYACLTVGNRWYIVYFKQTEVSA